ncbi:FAD-binding oxidoreductase [Nocardia sp. NPDC057227]|uniref:FAD-binding oxidoreductase n=1 Tax=Nocardia sp. NPDC057227 TaxID=3346056 RepID=UPI003625B819
MKSRIIRVPTEAGHALFLGALRAVVGPSHVLTDPAATRRYTTDATGHWSGRALAVVRPGSTDEVSAVVAACFDARVPIVPQGGNTGLVGGTAPAPGSILLSTGRLDRIEVNDHTVTAGAGVTVAAADHAATAEGLRFGIDLASRDSATLGGIVATDAGGPRRIRHGSARAQLLGIEAVLADGSVLSRSTAAAADNIGYDLPGLLAGSEGTLAVVTGVSMRLVAPAPDPHVLVAALDTVDAALRLHDRIRESELITEAAELMTRGGVALVRAHTGAGHPFPVDTPYYALFELSSRNGTERSALELLAASGDLIRDAVLAPAPARRLWQLREAHTEAIGRESRTAPVKLDVALPRAGLSAFLDALRPLLATDFPAARPILFGHFAEGSIHVNLLDVAPAASEAVTDAVFTLVAEHGGSISAEHGIGRAKAPWLHLGRSPIDVHAMNRIKAALDPRGILNPGVLLPR